MPKCSVEGCDRVAVEEYTAENGKAVWTYDDYVVEWEPPAENDSLFLPFAQLRRVWVPDENHPYGGNWTDVPLMGIAKGQGEPHQEEFYFCEEH